MASELESSVQTTFLLANLGSGHERAWAIFKKRFEPVIKGHCRRMHLRPQDVDEMTQEVLVKLFRALKAFASGPKGSSSGPKGSFLPWLKAVVTHSVIDYWRQRNRRPGDWGRGGTGVGEELRNVPAPADAALDEMAQDLGEQLEQDRRTREACERVKGRVEDRTWQAFWLTTVEDRSGKEVAERLGMGVAAVHMAKCRVLKMIRKEMEVDS